jgi:hypothetical protein
MSTTTVQPHPIIEDLFSALDTSPTHVDDIIVQINALIAGTHSYCWAHHRVEAARAGRCHECSHGWDTDQQLIDEDYEIARALWPNQASPAHTVNLVFVCPACSHDL